MTRHRLQFLGLLGLAGCMPVVDADIDPPPEVSLADTDLDAPAAESFELPAACDGWEWEREGPLPQRYVYIEYDGEIVALKSSGGVDCMRAVMRSLADDPPAEPLTIRLAGPEDAPPSRYKTVAHRVLEALRGPARSCGSEHDFIPLKLTIEPEAGRVVAAEIAEPRGGEGEACLVEEARKLEIGPLDISSNFVLTIHIDAGPPPVPAAPTDTVGAPLPDDAREQRMAALREFIGDVRPAVQSCTKAADLVQVQISYEGVDGKVIDARVYPRGHAAEPCIRQAILGRKLGPFADGRRGGARFPIQLHGEWKK